jgi:hypothetical protein
LNESDTENRILANLFLAYGSLVSIHPFFSSHVQAFLVDATGLADALSCAFQSDLGVRFLLPGVGALLLDPQDELQGLFFVLKESPIKKERRALCRN